MTLDEHLLRLARQASGRWADAQHQAELAKADYHHAVRLLHLGGASLREIADALDISHQRVHQIVDASSEGGGWKPRKKVSAEPVCGFCGRSKGEVTRLVAGPGVFICDSCVAVARDVIREPRLAGMPRTHIDAVPPTAAVHCTFCGESGDQVDALVAGPGVRICNRCVQICDEIVTARHG